MRSDFSFKSEHHNLTERLLFVPFWTSADEWLLVEAASGVIHAAPNQAEPETNQEWNLSHRKGSLLLGSPTEHYLYVMTGKGAFC